jgi:hypothetical protein
LSPPILRSIGKMILNRSTLLVLTLTALNLAILMLNLSARAKAEVGGLDWFALAKDDDFRRAVGNVVSKCMIDTERATPKITCDDR